MAEVKAGSDEGIDSLIKRFNKRVQQDGILAELRRGEFYEKPSIKRKRKKAAKKRNAAKAARTPRR